MDYYIDIELTPDVEMRKNVLMNKIFAKLHKALCDLDANDIGVSFPERKVMLGKMLRLHSTEERLKVLQRYDWLGDLLGYCKTGQILPVPGDAQYRVVSRVQTRMSQSKLKRLVKRGSISESDIRGYRAKMFTNGLDNPYLELESSSNGHKHRRYISFSGLAESRVASEFDKFGLSKTASVPWF